MRRSVLVALLVLWVFAPASRAATTDVSVANLAFSPAIVQIDPGDTVRWTFAGPDLNHSTTSDAGQAESWDSDPGPASPLHVVGDTFSHTFNSVGSYGYYCRVHSFMRGTVRVGAPPAQQPPTTGGGQPGAGEPAGQPPTGGAGGGQPQPGQPQPQQPTADTAAPVFATPRVSVARRRVSFKLDEAASVTGKLRGRKTKRTFTLAGKAGTNVLKLPRSLSGGRYTLALVATDAAGNASAPFKLTFSVPR
jgi:plastocyanin